MNNKKLQIHFDKPADFGKWESQTLPIGNGYMGASFFGGISKEKIVLNEKTMWKGGPSKYRPNYGGGNRKNAYIKVKDVQKFLANGEYDKAVELLPNLTGEMDGIGHYLLFCDAYLEFDGIDESLVQNYKRFLDLNESNVGVSFNYENVFHKRESFANYPTRVIALKFTTSEKGKLNFKLSLGNVHENCKIKTTENRLEYFGELDDNQLKYHSIFHLIADGELTRDENSISVKNSSEAVIYFSSSTDYADTYPDFRSGVDPYTIVDKAVNDAVYKGYDKLKSEHLSDYKELFDRVNINIFQGDTQKLEKLSVLSTDKLLEKYKNGCKSCPSYLEEIYFQYGRYLLISSSRAGSLPANLQGVWNESNNPPWGCDYHINVNLQMNYWHAYSTNIAETAKPLIKFLDSLRKPGRNTAKEYYNIISDDENPENGWTAHTQSTPFGWTTPGWDFYWGWSTAAVAWLMQNIWEYYEFTEDKALLEKEIYPIMRESALFYKQLLIWDESQQRLVSTPTYSPEHGPVTVGNTYEQSLIEQAFIDFIKAAEVLGKDKALCEEIAQMIPKLNPFFVGKNGLLKEWYEEDNDDFDTSKVEKNHRHISHLMALYPGKMISKEKTDLMQASIATLNDRGDDSTGWARAYKLNLWARAGDGNRAYKLLWGQIASCTYENLFDFHPPFQIDGNFGGTAGISEMLLQSQWNYIEVLPAIPDSWVNGSYNGLCARGGFEISAKWSHNKLDFININSKSGNNVKLKTEFNNVTCDGLIVNSIRNGEFIEFQTQRNKNYIIK